MALCKAEAKQHEPSRIFAVISSLAHESGNLDSLLQDEWRDSQSITCSLVAIHIQFQ